MGEGGWEGGDREAAACLRSGVSSQSARQIAEVAVATATGANNSGMQ